MTQYCYYRRARVAARSYFWPQSVLTACPYNKKVRRRKRPERSVPRLRESRRGRTLTHRQTPNERRAADRLAVLAYPEPLSAGSR